MVYCDGKILGHCEPLVGKNIRLNKIAGRCFMVARVDVFENLCLIFGANLLLLPD